jgi:hypothetical protein
MRPQRHASRKVVVHHCLTFQYLQQPRLRLPQQRRIAARWVRSISLPAGREDSVNPQSLFLPVSCWGNSRSENVDTAPGVEDKEIVVRGDDDFSAEPQPQPQLQVLVGLGVAAVPYPLDCLLSDGNGH